jgi:hypothetical protein
MFDEKGFAAITVASFCIALVLTWLLYHIEYIGVIHWKHPTAYLPACKLSDFILA